MCVPDTVLGAEDTVVNENRKVIAFMELIVLGGFEGFFIYFMKCDEYIVEDMSRVAKTTPRFDDSLGGLTGLII